MGQRIRSIKPEFWESQKLGLMSFEARLTFVGLISFADDEGRGRGDVRFLRNRIHPYTNDINIPRMGKILDELASEKKLVVFYQANDSAYYYLPGWREHQWIQKPTPSVHPCPPGQEGMSLGQPPNAKHREELYARDKYTCQYCREVLKGQMRKLSLDHVVPFVQGGNNSDNNLVTCCKRCNSIKHNRTPEQAGMTWPKGRGITGGSTDSITGGITEGSTCPGHGREGKGPEGMGLDLRQVDEAVGHKSVDNPAERKEKAELETRLMAIRMPFGESRGVHVGGLDPTYCQWLLDHKKRLNGDLKEALALRVELKRQETSS